ncbi:MAG: TPR end-of-group domain-containing protein, partial [Thermoanaerobaculia bacterium]
LEDQEERTYEELARKLMADLRSEESVPPQRVAQDLRLPALRRRAESGKSEAERLSARRLLAALFVQTSFYLPRQYLERRDARHASLCAAVAAHVSPERAGAVWYNFACLQAQAGDEKGALASLSTAVGKGFRDAASMEKDEDLESLRGEEAFLELLEGLKRGSGP